MSEPMLASIHSDLLKFAVPIDSLKQHPDNPREHDEDVLRESLVLNGQYGPILVQASTGHILAGNGTWAAALSLGWTHIAAVKLDVDDAQAMRILLRDNRSAQKSKNDPEALLGLLRELEGEFSGTGYQAADFTDLLATVEGNETSAVPVSDPAVFTSGDLRSLVLTYHAEDFDPLVRDLVSLQERPDETFTEVVQRLVLQAKAA